LKEKEERDSKRIQTLEKTVRSLMSNPPTPPPESYPSPDISPPVSPTPPHPPQNVMIAPGIASSDPIVDERILRNFNIEKKSFKTPLQPQKEMFDIFKKGKKQTVYQEVAIDLSKKEEDTEEVTASVSTPTIPLPATTASVSTPTIPLPATTSKSENMQPQQHELKLQQQQFQQQQIHRRLVENCSKLGYEAKRGIQTEEDQRRILLWTARKFLGGFSPRSHLVINFNKEKWNSRFNEYAHWLEGQEWIRMTHQERQDRTCLSILQGHSDRRRQIQNTLGTMQRERKNITRSL
jgi:hypothetical protein